MACRERYDTSQFLEHLPPSPWQARAREWRRRPLLSRRVICLAMLSVVVLPIWLLNSQRPDYAHAQAYLSESDFEPPYLESNVASTEAPLIPIDSSSVEVAEKLLPMPLKDTNTNAPSEAISIPPEPPTFSFIMFSADSAAEGAILIKVR